MHSIEYEVKLQALVNNVTSLMRSYRQGYDRAENLHFFERYRALRDGLQKDYPSRFGDLPGFLIPPPGTSMSGTTKEVIRRGDFEGMKREMEYCLEILNGLSFEPEQRSAEAEPTERFFGERQEYTAHLALDEVLRGATDSIRIVDGYISGDLFALISDKKPGVSVEILTKKVDEKTRLAAEKFAKQHGRLSLRTSDAFHDRFLLIDGKYYHLGASIKDAGKRAFMFTLLKEPSMIEALEKQWAVAWSAAESVV